MSDVLSQTIAEKPTFINKEQNDNSESQKGKPAINSMNVPVLPRSCKPLTHQVAGHRHGKGRLGIGMLQHADGSVLKPIQPPPRGEREVAFYKKLFDSSCDDPVLLTLRPFLPKFLGIWTPSPAASIEIERPCSNCSYLKLEDLCRRFHNPSILDVKVGRVSYDPQANDQKKSNELAKYPPLANLGFQLLGMRIAGPSPNEAVFYGKNYGWSLTEDKIGEGIDLYLSGNKPWKKYIVKAFLQRLEMILSWFESQQRYQFYSSSLLLIYEGEFMDGSSDSDEEFIHKYRQMQVPSLFGNSYLATVKQFVNSTKDKTSDVKNTAANIAESHSSAADSGRPTGQESGYSSEAESKLSNNKQKEKFQHEFVTSLNRRIQESSLAVNKYRFPPDIVDVRMIDFAHVFDENKADENYIFGLRNLILHFKEILKSL